jgi:hypothetical protein
MLRIEGQELIRSGLERSLSMERIVYSAAAWQRKAGNSFDYEPIVVLIERYGPELR